MTTTSTSKTAFAGLLGRGFADMTEAKILYILLHYPTGWPQKATITQRTVPLITVVLRPPPTVRAFPPLPSHLFSPIQLPNAN